MYRNAYCRWAAPLVVVAGLCTPSVNAVEIKLARHPDYHDGKIVFSYLGVNVRPNPLLTGMV